MGFNCRRGKVKHGNLLCAAPGSPSLPAGCNRDASIKTHTVPGTQSKQLATCPMYVQYSLAHNLCGMPLQPGEVLTRGSQCRCRSHGQPHSSSTNTQQVVTYGGHVGDT